MKKQKILTKEENKFLSNILDKRFFKQDTYKTEERWINAIKEFNNFEEFDDNIFTCFENNIDIDIIICNDININSLCSHHLFPYSAKIDIEYKPNNIYCGLSKLPRIAEHYSKRPCSQEELVTNIYNYLWNKLNPKYLKVIAKDGIHTCCNSRGIKKQVNYIIKKESKLEN